MQTPTKNTTQKTTEMSNTDPNKKHNTENYRDEQHRHQQKTTQKTTEMSNTDPNKKQHRKLQR
jgi:hypothetical protein